jgi:hypothetical protein
MTNILSSGQHHERCGENRNGVLGIESFWKGSAAKCLLPALCSSPTGSHMSSFYSQNFWWKKICNIPQSGHGVHKNIISCYTILLLPSNTLIHPSYLSKYHPDCCLVIYSSIHLFIYFWMYRALNLHSCNVSYIYLHLNRKKQSKTLQLIWNKNKVQYLAIMKEP